MSNNYTNRFVRQEGLVHQSRLRNLKVGIQGSNSLLERELGIIAEHLGVREFPAKCELDANIVLDNTTGNSCENTLNIQFRQSGFCLSTLPINGENVEPCSLLGPGLSTLAAALAWQEIMRRNGCLRTLPIIKKYATVQFRINPKFTQLSNQDIASIQARGEENQRLALFTSPCNDGTGHIRLSARLDLESEMLKQLLDEIDIITEIEQDKESDYTLEFSIPPIEKQPEGNLIVVGVGGLGSWSMYTLQQGVLASKGDGEGLNITIFDPDNSIEIHNLNRQVLYNDSHINRPKAICATEILQNSLPKLTIENGVQALGLPELDLLLNGFVNTTNEDSVDIYDELGLTNEKRLSEDDISKILHNSDLILCGVDNLQSRAVLSAMASNLNIPFINAGSENFTGQFDLFANSGCMACRYGAAVTKDRRIASCQEDGDVPVASIVTTTAIFGALEGLAALTALSNPLALDEWPEQMTWGGQSNILRLTSPPKFMQGDDHVRHILDSMQNMENYYVKVDSDGAELKTPTDTADEDLYVDIREDMADLLTEEEMKQLTGDIPPITIDDSDMFAMLHDEVEQNKVG